MSAILDPLGVELIIAENITIPQRLRALDEAKVDELAKSIQEIGLMTPVTIRYQGDDAILVAGRHRLAAALKCGMISIPVVSIKTDERDARLWEIAENLYRAELTALERSEHIAEWVRLTEEKRAKGFVQLAQNPQGGRPPTTGDSLASRELGITREQVRRAKDIAGMSDEAKEAAKAARIADNQAALLRVAAEPSAERQLAAIRREEAAAEMARQNRRQDRAVALTEAQQFADWILGRADLNELPQLISWLEGCKGADVIAALRREAA